MIQRVKNIIRKYTMSEYQKGISGRRRQWRGCKTELANYRASYTEMGVIRSYRALVGGLKLEAATLKRAKSWRSQSRVSRYFSTPIR